MSPTTARQHNPIHKGVRQGARDKKKTKHNPKHHLQALKRWEFRFISTWVTVCFHTAMLPWSLPAPLGARHQPSMRRREQPQHPLVAAPVFPNAIFYLGFFVQTRIFFPFTSCIVLLLQSHQGVLQGVLAPSTLDRYSG